MKGQTMIVKSISCGAVAESLQTMSTTRLALFAFGYPVAIIVIARFVPVVRQRRIRWLAIHHLAVACIVTGWAIKPDWSAVGINSAWLAASTVWYVRGGSRT
jgi:hypothetical protein